MEILQDSPLIKNRKIKLQNFRGRQNKVATIYYFEILTSSRVKYPESPKLKTN